ncbi:MAG: hypothetical protein AAGJ10_04500 [Bacteroidota bacterium]
MKRHLLIAFTLLVLVVLGVLARNASAVRLMVQNARALQDGADQAEALDDPAAVLDYVRAHPDRVSVLVVEDADTLVWWGRRDAMPLAGGRLHALAAHLSSALPDTAQVAETVTAFALPEDLATFAEAACTETQPCARADVADLVARGERRAYTDLLLSAAGTYRGGSAIPYLGYLLSWNNHTLNAPVADRLAAFQMMSRTHLDTLAYDIAQAYRLDEEGFRQREVAWRAQGGLAISLREQRDLAHATFPRATAAAMSTLLPAAPEVRLYSEAFPGLVLAAGVRPMAEGRTRTVVMLLEEVPLAVFYHLGRTRLDRGLVLELLHNDQAVARLSSLPAVASSRASTARRTR